MVVGYNVKKGIPRPRYRSWAANMIEASQRSQWKQMVSANYHNGVVVDVGVVGCLHWAYYSIMHYLGKGSYMQYALAYYEKEDDVVPSGGIHFDNACYREKFYKTEGLFCISSIILVLVLFFRKWFMGWVDELGFTYDSSDAFYRLLSRISHRLWWIVAALVLYQMILAFKSLGQGKRFGKYALNTILILLLPTGFGVVEIIYLVGLNLWYLASEENRGVNYRKKPSLSTSTSSNNASRSTYSNAKVAAYDEQRRMEAQREKEYEEYTRQRQEEKEKQRKEDQRYRLQKEVDNLKSKISILEKNNRDLDEGLKAYHKGSWSYNVDPKANRSKFEENLKEIGWLKQKIEKLEDELRRL